MTACATSSTRDSRPERVSARPFLIDSRPMDLKDRVALVAGGTGTLGIAIARALATAGAHVGITYLERKDAARETCAAVEALGRKAWSIALDQTDANAIPAAVKAAAGHFGRLDALVNNAGWNIAIPFPDLETLDAAVWDRLQSTNLRGPYLICRAAAPLPQGERLRPHREHRLGGRAESGRQQHRLRDEQGRAHPPHALPRGGARARGERELRGSRPHGGHADDLAATARDRRGRAPARGAQAGGDAWRTWRIRSWRSAGRRA